MTKFCVPIEREVLQYNYVVIEADSVEDAHRAFYNNDYQIPDDFHDRWETDTDRASSTQLARGRGWRTQLAKDCQSVGLHDHYDDDLSEDYLVSYNLRGDQARHHFKCHADDEYDAEEKLLAVVPNAKDIYVEPFEPEFEKLPGLRQG